MLNNFRFPAYNAVMDRMPSWFTEGHKKNFLLRYTESLQRLGTMPSDYIHRLLTQQEKAIQTPSTIDLQTLYGEYKDTRLTTDAESDVEQTTSFAAKAKLKKFPSSLVRRKKQPSLKVIVLRRKTC